MNPYTEITSTESLDEALDSSERQPVLFFKHSNTCGISAQAFAEFERYLASPESEAVRNCVIVVQTAREASNELARRVGIQHESPQAILVQAGQAVWDQSHLAIRKESLAVAAAKK
jgi:bacillithiol system protein YtxJ